MKKLLGGKKKMIIIPGIVLVVVLGAVFFAVPTLTGFPIVALSTESHAAPAGTATPDPSHAAKDATTEPGMMYALKERIVNLADQGQFHYLKSAVVLEFDLPDARGLKGDAYKKRQDAFVTEMASRQPKLDDILTTTLGTKTSAELSTADGKEKLRDELKSKFAEVVGEYKLLSVYFTQFIIQ